MRCSALTCVLFCKPVTCIALRVQRAHLHPRNVNSFCDFGPDSCGEEVLRN